MEKLHGHTLEYWKNNAEEDYLKVPISVLKYITCLEERIEQLTIPVVVLQSEQLFCVVDYFGNFTKGKEYLCKPEGKKHFEVCDNFGVWYSVNRKCFNKNNCTNKSPK
jgi:hypothetical protein